MYRLYINDILYYTSLNLNLLTTCLTTLNACKRGDNVYVLAANGRCVWCY